MRPGSTLSPSSASFTCMRHEEFSRSAKVAVKPAGICCTTRMPGASAGKAGRMSARAGTPPVEAPMTITRSVVSPREACTGSTVKLTSLRAKCPTLTAAAAFTRSQISSSITGRPSVRPMVGLAMTSTAPASSASRVMRLPACVSELMTTVGIGIMGMNRLRKVTPSMRGISTSKVITSGCSSTIRSRAR